MSCSVMYCNVMSVSFSCVVCSWSVCAEIPSQSGHRPRRPRGAHHESTNTSQQLIDHICSCTVFVRSRRLVIRAMKVVITGRSVHSSGASGKSSRRGPRGALGVEDHDGPDSPTAGRCTAVSTPASGDTGYGHGQTVEPVC